MTKHKDMKKTFTAIAVLLSAFTAADMYAQNRACTPCPEECVRMQSNRKECMLPKDRQQERMMMKAEMKCDRLMIEDGKRDLFMKTYAGYLKELSECHARYRNDTCRMNATDKEINECMADRFRKRHEILEIKEKYFKEFGKFLTARQVREIFFPERKHDRKPDLRHRPEHRGICPAGPMEVPETEILEDGTLTIGVPSERK